jgi:hypothetical protein
MANPCTEAVVSDFQDLRFVSVHLVALVLLFLIHSSIVTHQACYKSRVSSGSYSWLCSFHIFEGLHMSWCFSFHILRTPSFVLVSSWLHHRICFQYTFISHCTVPIFSSFPISLLVLCFLLVLQAVKDYRNLNISWKYTIDYRVRINAMTGTLLKIV